MGDQQTNKQTNKNMKMMINNDFSKLFEPLFEFDPVRTSSIQSRPPFRCERTDSESGIWEKCLSLEMLPTKSENLKIRVEDKKLIINGKSEIETKRNGFEIKSSHDWTRKIDIPDLIDPKDIKIKLSEKNLLKISAKKEETKDIEIMIE